MSVETNPLIGPDKLKERSEGKQEPKWLTDLRLDALNKVESLELPKPDKTKIHNWDFTSFTQELREPKEISSLDELSSDIQQFVDEEATGNSLLIQDNGKTIFQTNAAELADKGVVFCDFATAVKEHGDLVKKYLLTEAVSADENKLTAMHAALMEGGAFIYVPKTSMLKCHCKLFMRFPMKKPVCLTTY